MKRPTCLAAVVGIATTVVAHAVDYGSASGDVALYLAKLKRFYPEAVVGQEGNWLLLKDGTKLAISDGKTNKSYDELLNDPDIDDMFAIPYPAGAASSPPAVNADPGRVRVEALFRAIYGDCKAEEVRPRLREVAWLPVHEGGTVRFTTAAQADKALESVSRELDRLPSDLIKYLKPHSGSYNCRTIAGTDRMSMHSYAAAIDINVDFSSYWRWAEKNEDGRPVWENQIPKEIVEIFEKHGFIWGGRWHHFDTMHFEYRPELLP